MKAEDSFKLSLNQIFGIDKSTIDKYFKEFKKNFRNQPIVLDSLAKEIKDRDGNILDLATINQDVEELENNFKYSNPQFYKFFASWMHSWLDLFLNEIELQLDFAKESYNEYQTQKNKVSSDSKQLFRAIHHFSIHAANISKLIDKVIKPVNSIKAMLLSSTIDHLDADLSPLRKLRNHLEHFEERLDAWHYLHSGQPILDMNIINSSTKGLRVDECLRIMDIENDIIYILGEKFELNILYDLICKIENTFSDK
jgi:hypothetical protein